MAPKAKKLTPLVIDRAGWLTGEALKKSAVAESSLYDSETGLKCCLGFAAIQAGCGIGTIKNVSMPYEIYGKVSRSKLAKAGIASTIEDYREGTKTYYALDKKLNEIAGANDSETTSRPRREARIKAKLKGLGYAVKFVGEYPDYEAIAKKRLGPDEA